MGLWQSNPAVDSGPELNWASNPLLALILRPYVQVSSKVVIEVWVWISQLTTLDAIVEHVHYESFFLFTCLQRSLFFWRTSSLLLADLPSLLIAHAKLHVKLCIVFLAGSASFVYSVKYCTLYLCCSGQIKAQMVWTNPTVIAGLPRKSWLGLRETLTCLGWQHQQGTPHLCHLAMQD